MRRSRQKGNSIVEVALMAPWVFLLFLGVFDFGFYAYAAISTQHAARVAALYTSSSISATMDRPGACNYVLAALKDLPNVPSTLTTCNGLPVQLQMSTAIDSDSSTISIISVTYQTLPLFPIPGLMGQMTITRQTQMRVQT